MKKLSLVLVAMVTYALSDAAILTVSSNPSNVAQFSGIQSAINAAADGDTILVAGSPNNYGQMDVFDKKLTIVGPGWAPDKNLPHQAVFTGCRVRNSSAPGTPSGTELQGLIFTSTATLEENFGGDLPVNNLRIIRCQFNSNVSLTLDATGHLYEGCVFYNQFGANGGASYTNFIIQNNMFFLNNPFAPSITSFVNCVNILLNHNLFYRTGGNAPVFNACQFFTITNNIFVGRNLSTGISSSNFNSNITFNCVGNDVWNINGNVNAGGNIENTNPQMVAQASVDGGNGSPLLDFTIPSGPANNAGSDGKDIGLLYDATGSLNWTNSRNSRKPRIFSMNITTPTIAPGANISVTVEARKSN